MLPQVLLQKAPRLFLALAFLLVSAVSAQELPLLGIAHVGFKVSDFEKAKQFYTEVLGYEEAFRLSADGQVTAAYFKVNDDQFIKLVPVAAPAPDDRLEEIALQTSDVEALRGELGAVGVRFTDTTVCADGSLCLEARAPDGHRLLFVEYVAGSKQSQARGEFLNDRRISTKLWHTGISVANEAVADNFYRDRLGFEEIWRGGPEGSPTAWVNLRMPGARGDYIEYMLHDEPPSREHLGSMHHIALQVDDIQAGYQTAISRGVPDTERHQPRVGQVRRMLLNLFDPDGTRTELMEPRTVDPTTAAAFQLPRP